MLTAWELASGALAEMAPARRRQQEDENAIEGLERFAQLVERELHEPRFLQQLLKFGKSEAVGVAVAASNPPSEMIP